MSNTTNNPGSRERYYNFGIVWGRQGSPYDGLRLLKLAEAYGRLQVAACERELSRREKSREENIENEIREICERNGVTATFGGDPRGYTVKIHFEDGSYNTWGGKSEGWGI